MCHDSALVERPNCSSTPNHSTCVQPWPPCSTACRPPDSPRASASRRISATPPRQPPAPARPRAGSGSRPRRRAPARRESAPRSGCRHEAVRGAGRTARARDPRRRGQAHRPRGHRRRAHRPHRDGGRRVRERCCTTTSRRATPCSRRRSSTPTRSPATRAQPRRRAGAGHARLAAMIDQCLPSTSALRDDWVLWVELWLRAARHPELRPTAARLYARMHAWFAEAIAEASPPASSRAPTPRDGRPAARADRRLRHPRAQRGPDDAGRARPRGDLGGDGRRPGRR